MTASICTTIDLDDLGRRAYALRTGFRRIAFGSIPVFLLVALAGLAVNLYRHTLVANLVVTYGAAYIGLGFGVVISIWAYRMFSPGAIRLDVSPGGLDFHYANGRTDAIRWNDPRAKLTLWDWSAGAAYLPAYVFYEAAIPHRPRTALTKAAFDQIITTAESYGVVPAVRRASALWYGSPGRSLIFHGRRSEA